MQLDRIVDFFNSIQSHYQASANPFNSNDVIGLYIKYGSIQKMFEFLILSNEKDVTVDKAYLNEIFKEFDIDPVEVNKLLKKESVPKEPSFSKQALVKRPTFSKTNRQAYLNNSINEDEDSSILKGVSNPKKNDESDSVLNTISFLIPLVGIIYYAVNQDNMPIKSASALKSALLPFLIWIILLIIFMS